MDPDAHLLVMTVVQYWLIWDLANSCLCLEIIPGREVWCHALAGFWWPLKGQNMSLFIQVHRSRGHLHDLSSPQVSRTSLIKQVHNSEGHLSSNRSITQKDISHQTGSHISMITTYILGGHLWNRLSFSASRILYIIKRGRLAIQLTTWSINRQYPDLWAGLLSVDWWHIF